MSMVTDLPNAAAPLNVGQVSIANRVFLAPMSGVTDPIRLSSRQFTGK